MPSNHPQAKFDPITPDLDLHYLVDRTPNFEWVLRIPATQIRSLGPQEFENLVLFHVIAGGKPLVIEGWNDRLPKSLFSAEFLEKTYDKKKENVRDIIGKTDIPMTTGHYLRSMKQLTDQWSPTNFRDERRQRLYMKDIDCPVEWQDRLRKVIPPALFYLNENVEDRGQQRDDDDMFADHKVARAGDLMSSLPEEMRAQNLMCYIGHEGTYTPAHKEMCASLGQNIMVEASGNEKGEKPGSSIWFMTETKDHEVVREYFLSMLGHDIEIEKHFAQINAWKKATFPVYIVEQKAGDFILIPPLAPHQVWNRGTRTMKVAWNRTTAETLELALHEALRKARLVCRDEQYKNKAIIFYTLDKYYRELQSMEQATELSFLGISQDLMRNSFRTKQMANDFKKLLRLFTEVLADEMFATKEKNIELIPFDSNITCSYCRCNVFNRFLTCKHCVRQLIDGSEDTFDICMECYAMGRSCICISGLSWCEQWPWVDLVDKYNSWCEMVIKNDGYFDQEESPMPLEIARLRSGKKSVAQICQEQLRRRPFKDITKADAPSDPEPSEHEVDDDGRVIKKKPKRKKKKGDTYRCHVCCHREYTYKLAFCSKPGCTEAYCYGVLYRAFDETPQGVMQELKWQCPKCRNICNCGSCRRAGNTVPYTPKSTLLGHDTRPLADDRSVEAIVDFRMHNLSWLKAAGDESRGHDSKRMQKLRQAADAEKAKDGDGAHVPGLANRENGPGLDDAAQGPMTNGNAQQVDGAVHSNMPPAQDLNMGIGTTMPDHGQAAGLAEGHSYLADNSMAYDEPSAFEDSYYPDPTLPGRMLGLGYYQQDDSPDKILFDPYQTPTAEDMEPEEHEPSEYVKKAIRAAKRRARMEEDDDPDFLGPKSHHRKKQRLDKDMGDQSLVNLDPALLAGPALVQESPMGDADWDKHDAQPQQAETSDATMPEQEEQVPEGEQAFEANKPLLRQARPKASYVEIDDGVEEFNEALPVHKPTTSTVPAAQNKDSLDLAADAIRLLTGQAPEKVPDQAPEQNQFQRRSSYKPTGRPRGRPAGRPRRSDPSPSHESAEAPQETSTPQPSTGKRRGRPPRSAGPRASALHRSTRRASSNKEDGSADGEVEAIGELEAQLARELAEADEEGQDSIARPTVARRRGRPPKKNAVASPGRASKSVTGTPTAPNNSTFLSMAERIALRGKKIKISQRRVATTAAKEPDASAAAEVSTAVDAHDDGDLVMADDAEDEARDPEQEAMHAPVDAQPETSKSKEHTKDLDDAEDEDDGEDDGFESAGEEDGESAGFSRGATLSHVKTATPNGSGSSASSTPTPSFASAPSGASSRPVVPSALAGPTVVRLGDTSEEEDEAEFSDDRADSSSEGSGIEAELVNEDEDDEHEDDDEDDDDDDEGIPASRPGTVARTRGTAVRGRGGVRGRGRGRGGRATRGGRR